MNDTAIPRYRQRPALRDGLTCSSATLLNIAIGCRNFTKFRSDFLQEIGPVQIQRPPSTSMQTPVIMLASSLHR